MAAEKKGVLPSLDTQQRIKTDHELFLEAYEKPTQIYRFLKSRHLLEPVFLQRNLSYMKDRKRKRRAKRKSVKLNDITEQTKEKKDISAEIKSDNHLKITFHSLDYRKNSSPADTTSQPVTENVGKPMLVEVLLYKFKQPSADVLVTTPTSLPCDCTSLGKCILPDTGCDTGCCNDKCSITIPSSLLSYSGHMNGEMPDGTHMLAFRVIPFSQDEHNSLHVTPERRQLRKRKQNGLVNGEGSVDNQSGPICNGFTHSKESNHVSSGHHRQEHHNKKAPGGKTLPIITSSSFQNNLVISIARDSLESSHNKEPNDSRNSGQDQCTRLEKEIEATRYNHSLTDNCSNDLNSRKRNRSDSDTIHDEVNRPAKKSCMTQLKSPPQEQSTVEAYCAELVAFDSRQECLLLDGEYELNMTKFSHTNRLRESTKTTNGFKTRSLFTLEKRDNRISSLDIVTMKLSINWSLGSPPPPRIEELNNTALDFDKLRKKYEELLGQYSSPSQETSTVSSSSKTTPTAFNFMYHKNTLQQTELKVNYVCPWCSLDCKQLYPLLKHMSLCHPRFLFTYSPIEGGSSVDVRINKMYDSYPSDHVEKDLLARKKRPTKCQPSTSILVKSKTDQKDDLNEFMASAQFSKPKSSRLFYHTHSCLPMIGNEKDSDDERVPNWLKMTSSKMVDEFIDVNQGEKQFMKMWNLFTMEYTSIADKQLPHLCLVFAQRNKDELIKQNMVYNFLSHVIYMCDIGLVPPSTISEINKTLHSTTPTQI